MNRGQAATSSIALGVAAFVSLLLWRDGAYYAGAAGVAGAVAVVGATAAYLLGIRPARAVVVAAAALVSLGVWAVLSAGWGGLPHTGWRFLGLMLAAAAALVLGSALAGTGLGRQTVLLGVGAGLALTSAVSLAVVSIGQAPDDWFLGRQFVGPVGYHNAQGAVCVIGIPIALWATSLSRGQVRAVGAASSVLLLATALLTQSRGTLLAVLAAVALQLALARRSRILAIALALAACGSVLFVVLRSVDRALAELGPDDPLSAEAKSSLARFVLVSAVCALLLAAVAIPKIPLFRPRPRLVRTFVGFGVLLIVAGGLAAGLFVRERSDELLDRVRQQPNDVTQTTAGATRYSSLSSSGRLAQWRVAWEMAEERPLQGSGVGTFARRFTVERDHKDLYVLQPHSLVLELLSELGIVALLAGAVFVGATAVGLRGGDRGVSAAVGGALAGFLLFASVDWIFSFAGLLVPLMLLAGAAAGSSHGRVPRVSATAVALAAAVAALGLLLAPALAERRLESARQVENRDLAEAWTVARGARELARWDPEIVSYQGRLAERFGRFRLAAELYGRAAELSRQPWTDTYRRARALRRAGLRQESAEACLRAHAQNPLEPELTSGVCGDI